jgi:hypothetical protein
MHLLLLAPRTRAKPEILQDEGRKSRSGKTPATREGVNQKIKDRKGARSPRRKIWFASQEGVGSGADLESRTCKRGPEAGDASRGEGKGGILVLMPLSSSRFSSWAVAAYPFPQKWWPPVHFRGFVIDRPEKSRPFLLHCVYTRNVCVCVWASPLGRTRS